MFDELAEDNNATVSNSTTAHPRLRQVSIFID